MPLHRRLLSAASTLPPLNPAAGRYFFPLSQAATATINVLGNNVLRVLPWYLHNPLSVDRVCGEVTTAGEAGSKVRLGLYLDNGNGLPGALLLDAGQIAGDAVAVAELTVATTVIPAGLVWIGGAIQSAATTQPTVRSTSDPIISFVATSASAPTNAPSTWQGYQQSGVTGALPSTFVASGNTNSIPRIHLRTA